MNAIALIYLIGTTFIGLQIITLNYVSVLKSVAVSIRPLEKILHKLSEIFDILDRNLPFLIVISLSNSFKFSLSCFMDETQQNAKNKCQHQQAKVQNSRVHLL